MSKKESNKEKKKNNFFKELKAELKKVTWPTFKKLVNNTVAVISIVLILSIIVFILDVCFENLNKFGIEGLKTIVSSDTENQDTAETDEINEETNNLGDGIDLVSEEEIDENSTEENNESSEIQPDENSEEITQ